MTTTFEFLLYILDFNICPWLHIHALITTGTLPCNRRGGRHRQ